MTLPLQILFALFCLMGTAFFSGMETGVISINSLRLRHLVRNKIRGAAIIQSFLDHPDNLLGTTLVGTNLCTVTASVLGAGIATTLLGSFGPAVSSISMTFILLIFCEYLPKAWFQSNPARRIIPFASLLRWASYLFRPVGKVVTGITNIMIPSSIRKGPGSPTMLTREELKYLTREGEQSGTFSAHERRMIHGVFELTKKRCDEIMIPLDKMILVSSDTKHEDVMNVARLNKLTRLPVYQDEPDHVVGLVHVMDLAFDEKPTDKYARDYMRPPQFVPAETPINELLPRMQLTRQPMALVTDEESAVLGLVTTQDVLQEIVGKL